MPITFIVSQSEFTVVAGGQRLTVVTSSALTPFSIGGVLLVFSSFKSSREGAFLKHILLKAMLPRTTGHLKTRETPEWPTSWVSLLRLRSY
jgi:hypothetical protein